MFSFHRKEEPFLELYGKLPIAKDYLRVGCASDAGRRLREWLDRGFAGELGSGTAPVPPYPMRFLWTDRAGAVLQGTIRPSCDAGGLRVFPLVLFVERRTREIASERARARAGDEGWWRALARFHAELGGFTEGSALLTSLRGRKVVRSEEGNEETGTGGVDLPAWVETLWPGEGRSGYERVLRELEILSQAAERERGGRIVRFPLAWGRAMGPQVDAWMRALDELGWAKDRSASTLFYPDAGSAAAPAFLLVLPAAPEAADASWLLGAPRSPAERGDLCWGRDAPVHSREDGSAPRREDAPLGAPPRAGG